MKLAESLLRVIARLSVGLLCLMPLRCAAQIGRAGGGLMYYLDARHRRVARQNLTLCFADSKTPAEIRQIARENFRRIGENICAAVKITSMDQSAAARCLEIVESGSAASAEALRARNVMLASGHFGSFRSEE